MAGHPGGGRSATDLGLLSVMSQILASGPSHHDTEELLGEALETDGIYPAVAWTAGSLGGPSGRCSGPPYLLGMARRLQRSINEALAQSWSDDEEWGLLRAAFRMEVPYFHRHIEEWHSRMVAARKADGSR
jgi:hypothetical protein